jgi:hypothetical protein
LRTFIIYVPKFFLEWEMLQQSCREIQNTNFLSRLGANANKNYGTAWQAIMTI